MRERVEQDTLHDANTDGAACAPPDHGDDLFPAQGATRGMTSESTGVNAAARPGVKNMAQIHCS